MLYMSNRNQQNNSKRGSRGRKRRKDINIRKESEKKELEEDTINNLRSCNPFLQDISNNNQINNDHQQSILKVDPSSSVLEKTSRKRKFEDIEKDDYQSNIDDKNIAYKTKRAKHNDTNLDSKISYEKNRKKLINKLPPEIIDRVEFEKFSNASFQEAQMESTKYNMNILNIEEIDIKNKKFKDLTDINDYVIEEISIDSNEKSSTDKNKLENEIYNKLSDNDVVTDSDDSEYNDALQNTSQTYKNINEFSKQTGDWTNAPVHF